jgi:hypothetical protein
VIGSLNKHVVTAVGVVVTESYLVDFIGHVYQLLNSMHGNVRGRTFTMKRLSNVALY